jgi:hypothetical protein
MIGSIRKHSKWLWWFIAGLTIISFVFFMGSGPSRNRGGGAGGGYGTLYGHEISAEDYARARNEFFIFYWQHYNGEWPDKNPSINRDEIERETYVRILLSEKAKSLGIHIPTETVVLAATEVLRNVGRNGQAVPMDQFVEHVLKPEGLTEEDFQRYVRSDLMIQQLGLSLGLSGSLVTPQEAATLYDREHQEVSAQAVFFSVSNYLSQVTVTPGAVGQFFTNYLAAYRVPDRVQVNYVWFNLTNFLEQSKAEWAKTNLEVTVEDLYRQYGSTEFKDAKTPEEAKSKIRDGLIKRRAFEAAVVQARDFVKVLFAMEPVKPENLAAVAKQKNLEMHTTVPFSEGAGPLEFTNAPSLTKTAFALNADSPFSDAIGGEDGIYVIGLAKQLPSSVPTFAEVQARATEDFKMQQAFQRAQSAGTNFYATATVQVMAGKTFAQAAVAEGRAPVILSPFSLSSTEVPEAADHAEVGQLKQAAFTTRVGGVSHFVPTADGGFVLFVQSLSPADAAKKAADLPQFTSQVRRGRQNEAFNIWINNEANRELRDTPFNRPQQAGAAK